MTIEFLGYHRPDGRIGVRNYLLVLSVGGLTGPVSRRVAKALNAMCIVLPYEAGLIGEDKRVHDQAAIGLVSHPNVGAALMIGDNPSVLSGLAEKLHPFKLSRAIISMDECGNDTSEIFDRAVETGRRIISEASVERRPAALSALVVGVECGRSDPSSGLVANPLVGRIVDRLIDVGGTAIFGETIEWLGAEHLLAKRAKTPEIALKIVAAVKRREEMAINAGFDLLGRNPTPTNIATGISTIEEKSVGSIAKSGARPISGVLGYAETASKTGLWAMDAPAFAPESLTGFVAAGAQIILFTTGVGNSYVSALSPTIKISANPETCSRLGSQIDFSAAKVFEGSVLAKDLESSLFELLITVANGYETKGEKAEEGDEIVSRFGAAL